MLQYQELFPTGFPIQVHHVQSVAPPILDEGACGDGIDAYLKNYFGVEEWWEYDGTKCIVSRYGEPVGTVEIWELSNLMASGETIGSSCPIELSHIIPSDVPLFKASATLLARLLAQGGTNPLWADPLWVLKSNRITGTFGYRDLFKLPGILCLFGLTIELEMAALDLCRLFFKQCWDVLPEGRQGKAIELWHKRNERDSSRRDSRLDQEGSAAYYKGVIECTTFIDKATMIGKCKLLIDTGGNRLNSIFNRAEEVRNACAHPAENDRIEALLPLEGFVKFVADCRKLIDSIRMVTPKN